MIYIKMIKHKSNVVIAKTIPLKLVFVFLFNSFNLINYIVTITARV